MESSSVILDVLSDLLKINRDRVVRYHKAITDTDDPGLKTLFQNNADQSRKNISDIINEVMNYNGNSKSAELTNSDKIYHAWATFKTKFSGNNIKNVLTSRETTEATSIKSSHEVIRVYRQAYMEA